MNGADIATEPIVVHVTAPVISNSAPPPLPLTGAVLESVLFHSEEEEDDDPAGGVETEAVLGDSVVVESEFASLKIFASGEFGGRFNIAACNIQTTNIQ